MTSCAAAISHGDRRLAAKPEVAIHMAKTQLRGLARQEGLGDTTETDGDLLTAASSGGAALRCPAAGGRVGSSPRIEGTLTSPRWSPMVHY